MNCDNCYLDNRKLYKCADCNKSICGKCTFKIENLNVCQQCYIESEYNIPIGDKNNAKQINTNTITHY